MGGERRRCADGVRLSARGRCVIRAGTPLAEFYRLSMAAIGPAAVVAGALTRQQAEGLVELPGRADFLACGFVHVGVWGRLPIDGAAAR
jgi:hypothetical protein